MLKPRGRRPSAPAVRDRGGRPPVALHAGADAGRRETIARSLHLGVASIASRARASTSKPRSSPVILTSAARQFTCLFRFAAGQPPAASRPTSALRPVSFASAAGSVRSQRRRTIAKSAARRRRCNGRNPEREVGHFRGSVVFDGRRASTPASRSAKPRGSAPHLPPGLLGPSAQPVARASISSAADHASLHDPGPHRSLPRRRMLTRVQRNQPATPLRPGQRRLSLVSASLQERVGGPVPLDPADGEPEAMRVSRRGVEPVKARLSSVPLRRPRPLRRRDEGHRPPGPAPSACACSAPGRCPSPAPASTPPSAAPAPSTRPAPASAARKRASLPLRAAAPTPRPWRGQALLV